jgi:hypothetical protein
MNGEVVFTPAFPALFDLFAYLFTPGALWVVFYAAVLLFAIVSATLLYHWLRYNVGMFRTLLVVSIYYIGSAIFLSTAYASLLLF